MILEQSKYIQNYYGINRSIYLNNKIVKIIFNAYLYENLDIEYVKEYESETDAINEMKEYVLNFGEMKERIGYSRETIDLVNDNIYKFSKDASEGKIYLPEGFSYKGDLKDLKEGVNRGHIDHVNFR